MNVQPTHSPLPHSVCLFSSSKVASLFFSPTNTAISLLKPIIALMFAFKSSFFLVSCQVALTPSKLAAEMPPKNVGRQAGLPTFYVDDTACLPTFDAYPASYLTKPAAVMPS